VRRGLQNLLHTALWAASHDLSGHVLIVSNGLKTPGSLGGLVELDWPPGSLELNNLNALLPISSSWILYAAMQTASMSLKGKLL